MKICSKCKLEKDDSCFTKHRNGLRARCKECIKIISNQFYLDNKTEISYKKKIYYEKNRVIKLENVKEYGKLNKSKRSNYKRERYSNDVSFRLRSTISRSIANSLHLLGSGKKKKSCIKYLSYNMQELKAHIEKQFEPWMTWDNQGKYNIETWDDNDPTTWTWQLDHIVPQSFLLYTSMEDDNFKKCWAFSNLRPLSAKQNVIDGNRRAHE